MSGTLGILVVNLVLLALAHGQTEKTSSTVSHTETETIEYGPIGMVVNQLAGMAVDVSDRTSTQLQENIENALTDLTGNIEMLAANAFAEVSGSIEETNELLLANTSCNAAWNLQEFTVNVTRQLSSCTQQLSGIVGAYRSDGQQLLATVQSFVQQMAQLPMQCQGALMGTALGPLGMDPAGSSNCFMNGITAINQGLASAMHNASLLLVRTRRLPQEQLAQAQRCTSAVVGQVLEYLNSQRENCS